MINKKRGKIEAISLIANLILAIISFSFIVSAFTGNPPPGATHIIEVGGQKIYVVQTGDRYYTWTEGGKLEELIVGKEDVIKPLGSASSSTTQPTGSSPLSKLFKLQTGGVADAIVSGAMWAGIAYGVVQLIGSILGLQPETRNALSYAAAAGFGVGKLIAVGGQEGGFLSAAPGSSGFLGLADPTTGALLPAVPWVAGIVAGLIILELTYKKESKKIVTFECNPWEAPTGGSSCAKCNDEFYPCTEYRCKSLGQACQLLNAGTGEEACAWVNPQDVKSPIIKPWKEVLTFRHEYVPDNAIRPPDRGVKIINKEASDGCVKAFTPLTFGVQIEDESGPAQCKIDYNRTFKYDQMAYYFGNSNIYKYNHTQTLRLPNSDALNAEVPELKADGTYSLYVRCQDANGNANDDLFVFSFCVEKGPDVTAPKIEATSIANNMPIQYGLNETNLEVYVNEPAECRWSKIDLDYSEMENQMSCSQHVWEMNNLMLYKCTTKLTGLLDRQDNMFYFRCKDQPWLGDSPDRNTNMEGYKFTLKGTQQLNIKENSIKPNETVRGYTSPTAVYLELETENGYNFGDAYCSYSPTQEEKDYIQMYETGTNKHRQRLDLPSGTYTYYFQCVDLGGNADKASTTFNVEIDINPPKVVRVYKSGNDLKIITDEKSSCSYSNNEDKKCNFAINEGINMPYANSTEHSASWLNKNYYIKCRDLTGRQPSPVECSIIVKPYNVK